MQKSSVWELNPASMQRTVRHRTNKVKTAVGSVVRVSVPSICMHAAALLARSSNINHCTAGAVSPHHAPYPVRAESLVENFCRQRAATHAAS